MRHKRMARYVLAAAVIAALLGIVGIPHATVLPLALLLACPMMVFMMRRMRGRHGDSGNHTGTAASTARPARSRGPPTVNGDLL